MFIKKEIDWEYISENSWAGAVEVVREIKHQGREEEAWEVVTSYMDADAIGGDLPTETDVNDFIWFELADIMNLYGDSKEEDGEEEE
jgi:hypothetical protein